MHEGIPAFMPPLLDLRLLVRYHGVKATQYFSKFTDDSVSVFKRDLIALGLPHPKASNVSLLSHGLVQCFWPSARQNHTLHTNLLVKTRGGPTFEQLTRSLSITNITVKENRINSSTLHRADDVNLKRSHTQIDSAGRDESMNYTRPNKVAKTEARGFDLQSRSDSSVLPDFRNAHNASREATQPNASTTASYVSRRYPSLQEEKSSQKSSQPNGIRNANSDERAVNDFLHNLLSEDTGSFSSGLKKPTDTPAAALSKSAESLWNRGGPQSATYSDSAPGRQKSAVQIPMSNPAGIPGLYVAGSTIQRNIPASHLPSPPSSAHSVRTAQNVQPLIKPSPASFSRPLKPTNSHDTVPPVVSQQGTATNASDNRVQSSTMGLLPAEPYSSRISTHRVGSYAKFDPVTKTYTAVHYSPPSSSNPSSAGPRRHPAPSHNGSTSHEHDRSNIPSTATLSSSAPSSRPPLDQRPVITPPLPVTKATSQGSDAKRPLIRPFSSLSATAPIQRPFPPRSFPCYPSPAAPNGNGAKMSAFANGDPKEIPHLTLIAKGLRQKVGESVKQHGEVSDELQRMGSAWVPEKLVVVETGSKGKERDHGHDYESNAELEVLKATLAAVQQLGAKEGQARAESQMREEAAKAELELLKTKLDAVQKLRTEEARISAEDRKLNEAELELLESNLAAVRKPRAEDANLLVAERNGRRAQHAELEALKTKLASVEKERDGFVKMLTDERRWRAEADKSLQRLRNEEAKMLAEEQRRRDEAENALADVRRECRRPFVVPSLLDIFVELSKLTTKGLRLTNSMNGPSGSGNPSLNSQKDNGAALPSANPSFQGGVVAVSQVMGLTRTLAPVGNPVAETSRVKLEPLDTTL